MTEYWHLMFLSNHRASYPLDFPGIRQKSVLTSKPSYYVRTIK